MKKIELILGFKCNCRCVFCVVDANTAAQSMDTACAIAHLRRCRSAGADEVDFGGGEPTLRADLPVLARAAKKLGYQRIGVKSNGLRLCYPEYVEELLRAGVGRFAVPIWGDSPAVHDTLSRTPGAFDKLEMGIKNAVDLGAELEADILLTRLTVPRLRELSLHFAGVGVRRFQAWLFCLFGSDYGRPELLPTLTAAGRAVVAAAEALERRGARIGTTQIPCCFLKPREDLYANIAASRLEIITPGGSFAAEVSPFEAGRKTGRCRGCSHDAACAGVRPEYLERFSDREIEPLTLAPEVP